MVGRRHAPVQHVLVALSARLRRHASTVLISALLLLISAPHLRGINSNYCPPIL